MQIANLKLVQILFFQMILIQMWEKSMVKLLLVSWWVLEFPGAQIHERVLKIFCESHKKKSAEHLFVLSRAGSTFWYFLSRISKVHNTQMC